MCTHICIYLYAPIDLASCCLPLLGFMPPLRPLVIEYADAGPLHGSLESDRGIVK